MGSAKFAFITLDGNLNFHDARAMILLENVKSVIVAFNRSHSFSSINELLFIFFLMKYKHTQILRCNFFKNSSRIQAERVANEAIGEL